MDKKTPIWTIFIFCFARVQKCPTRHSRPVGHRISVIQLLGHALDAVSSQAMIVVALDVDFMLGEGVQQLAYLLLRVLMIALRGIDHDIGNAVGILQEILHQLPGNLRCTVLVLEVLSHHRRKGRYGREKCDGPHLCPNGNAK